MEASPEVIVKGRRLGKLPRGPEYHKVLAINRYLTVERAPKKVDYQSALEKKIGKFPMLMNDELGDCTCAAKLHGLQIMNDVAGRDFRPTDAMALEAYEGSCGYMPSDPTTDQGGNMVEVAKFWRNTGIGGDKILAFARVDPFPNEMRLAIDIFGGIDVGINLPLSAQEQDAKGDIWHVVKGPTAEPGTWGGHDVFISRYDPKHFVCVTWDEQKPMTLGFIGTYCDERFCYITESWLNAQGSSVTGLDLAGLRRDLEAKIGPVVALNRYLTGDAIV